ncbi:BatD family protein [Chryseolinea sp. H1M3-3]|uniref:BatD family protein n=1 Tax=Chryseolinea sp. H1M3-3 TaxID=3034144 RepID=UPI0023EC85DC|nr:BatD family protein [Chryseolinea sp. H1M3-3]
MKLFFNLLLLFSISLTAAAQQVQVTLGPSEIAENQAWTITVTVQNDRLKSYDNFPEIKGFRKRGQSTQSTTNIVNGQISSSQSVIMTYMPMQQGTITVPSFTMKVNDKPVSVPGKKVKIGAPQQQQQRDPFRNFFDRSPADDFFGEGETEFVDIKEDAFLAITASKDEVYIGEGFNTTLSFFVSQENRAQMQFYELGRQLAEILKKIKPTTCWEENFNIENIDGENVKINGRDYTQYKIYQATYYPLNTEPIKFPSVGLEMIKYKVAKNPSYFGQNRQEDFKTFYTKAKRIKVKELPPHPLKNSVAVGDYRLDERIRSKELETGRSAGYNFNIYGEGNISAITKPNVKGDEHFEFYEPNVRQDINRQNNRVTGTKSFDYFMIPKEPGKYKLGDYFQWVFFNPRIKKYDTLRSKLIVNVSGESKKNEAIQASDVGNFYDKIDGADNTLKIVENDDWQSWAFNSFILVMLAASAYLVLRK